MQDQQQTRDYFDDIASALATEGGHLAVGRGGFILHFRNGAMLSGYDCETIKAQCIAAGLPVIDSRPVDISDVAKLALKGPMIAVGRKPDPTPWHGFSYAPLGEIAAAYAAAGAEVWNVPGVETASRASDPGTAR
ncbi:hypothetical protein ATER59S_00358 [Aquamicrobium terrae]